MEHSYLVIAIVVAALGSAAVPLARAPRLALAGGALAAPAGLADALFVPEYWDPVHVVGAWFSVEGLLFSFGNGCLIVAMASRLDPAPGRAGATGLRRPLARLTVAMALGFAAFLAAWRGAVGQLMIMHATFVGFAAIAVLLLVRGTVSLRNALLCGFGFLAIYGVETLLWDQIDPGARSFWQDRSAYLYHLPFPPFLPIEEYLWAFLYGTLWSALILDAFTPAPGPGTAVTSREAPGRPDC